VNDEIMKNFLPGPTAVHADVLAELVHPISGHHTTEFKALVQSLKPGLQNLMGTVQVVFTLTCTASAAMEAALCNAGGHKILVVSNGAFGERWLQMARSLGLAADGLILGWGLPLPIHEVRRVLDQVGYDTLVMVHGESSTGMLNPLEPVRDLLVARPNVLWILDAVATLGGVPVSMDEDRIDVLVGASQKCLALPPGITPVGVSEQALRRSRTAKRKGYAYDFTLWEECWQRNQTVATPAIPQLRALKLQLERMQTETLEARWRRHAGMLNLTTSWAERNGLVPFPPEGYRLPSVSCLHFEHNGDTYGIVEQLRERGYLIDDGYGKLKGRTLRIGHMGEWTEEELAGLLTALEELLE
jgi:aspartate aminotransferase-like enzyme